MGQWGLASGLAVLRQARVTMVTAAAGSSTASGLVSLPAVTLGRLGSAQAAAVTPLASSLSPFSLHPPCGSQLHSASRLLRVRAPVTARLEAASP